ncbi:hypothetical protein CAXC1_240010 [Candidatus Xenohaliotis californiensis]|uniref:Uncharacterized protein n=1 Tax=Candidatus Xenohaliotis californiensis TaxID=84677 RepID=A0ABP0EST3_9RICK|nr:hypothetical protein CAXC1_240010 [Candidatus Xenohaliotis californiensis]
MLLAIFHVGSFIKIASLAAARNGNGIIFLSMKMTGNFDGL